MRIFWLLFFFLASAKLTKAQTFCGVIKYRYTYYKGKNEKDVTATVKEIKTEEFYICGNNFKTIIDGKLSEIMIGDSSAYFFVVSDSVVGYVKADSSYGQNIPEYGPVKKCQYKGRDYKCLEEKSRGQAIPYYFDDHVKIEPDQFRDVELYHWNRFFRATNGALRLVSVNKNGRWLSVSEAVEIITMNHGQIDFAIPLGLKIEKREGFKVYN